MNNKAPMAIENMSPLHQVGLVYLVTATNLLDRDGT